MKDLQELRLIFEKEIRSLSYPVSPNSLYDPIEYIIGLEAKRIRPLLVLMAYQIFDKDLAKALSPAIAIEFFHNFTLLHDDIMDNAPIRRGSLTVHQKWNNNTAILSGDVMMIQAYSFLEKVDSGSLKAVLNIFNKTAVKVCEGQQWDMDFETQENVDLGDYIQMIEYKTAVLLGASLQIGAITAGASQEDQDHLYNFGVNIGIAFQLKDDLLDAFGSAESFGKQVGGDILENKKTFLYLKSLQLADNAIKKRLKDYYINNDKSEEKINSVKEIFISLDIQKHTIDLMKTYYAKATAHLDAIKSKDKEPLVLFSEKLMHRLS